MKNKIIFTIILMVLLTNIFINNTVYATESSIYEIFTKSEEFMKKGTEDSGIDFDYVKIKNTSNTIANILIAIGTVIAVIVSSILGIKFMIGSVEEKAQIKEALVPFVIGCIVIFGAFTIWKIFVNIGNSIVTG